MTYSNTAEIKNDVLFRLGEPTDGTSKMEPAVKQYINRAYQAIWTGGAELQPGVNEEWWWLRERGIITLEHGLENGTVSVTKGSDSIAFSSGPSPTISNNVQGWFLKTDNHADVFKITSHTSGATGATLESVWTDDTSTGETARLYNLDYDLASGALYIADPMRVHRDNTFGHRHEIRILSLEEFDQHYPASQIDSGIPRWFAPVDENTVRFNAYPKDTDLVKVDYQYIKQPADLSVATGETSLIPRQYRRVLALAATYWAAQDKGDQRRGEYLQEAQALLNAMVKENRNRWANAGEIGHLFPRTRSGFNRGGKFDDFPLRSETGRLLGGF